MAILLWFSVTIAIIMILLVVHTIVVGHHHDRALKMTSSAADSWIEIHWQDEDWLRADVNRDGWREYYNLLDSYNFGKQVFYLHRWTFSQVYPKFKQQLGEITMLSNLTS